MLIKLLMKYNTDPAVGFDVGEGNKSNGLVYICLESHNSPSQSSFPCGRRKERALLFVCSLVLINVLDTSKLKNGKVSLNSKKKVSK